MSQTPSKLKVLDEPPLRDGAGGGLPEVDAGLRPSGHRRRAKHVPQGSVCV